MFSFSLQQTSKPQPAKYQRPVNTAMDDDNSSPAKQGKQPVPNDMLIGGEKTEVEIKLERDGDINALQRYRYLNWRENATHLDVSNELLDTEENLREVVQEELAIKEGDAPPGTNTQERLGILNTKYWLLSQRWWYCRSGLGDCQSRAFNLWRSHPRWYLHSSLVEECAGRQGCCARGCGCCQNRKLLPSRSLGAGHCSLECACCRKARGFEVSVVNKKLLKEQIKKNLENRGNRITRYRLVSIWGLVNNSQKSPFDMIDAPPSYE
ncbi:unnamed protein product [Penicillium olsonii]|nr:unnamed protein product [Penicillium olsonii]